MRISTTGWKNIKADLSFATSRIIAKPRKDDGLNSVDVGKGVINWKDALTTAVNTGMKYFIVEQEAYPGTTPLEAIRANAKYMMQFL